MDKEDEARLIEVLQTQAVIAKTNAENIDCIAKTMEINTESIRRLDVRTREITNDLVKMQLEREDL